MDKVNIARIKNGNIRVHFIRDGRRGSLRGEARYFFLDFSGHSNKHFPLWAKQRVYGGLRKASRLTDALEFAFRVFIKQGIWIVGAAWLFAIGSQMIYSRSDGAGKASNEMPEVVKHKLILGVIMLGVGIIIALIPAN
jgi:hypothetical protein